MDENKSKSHLKLKIIITIITLLLIILLIGTGVWAYTASKNQFTGYIDVITDQLDARITARVTGVKNDYDIGYASEKVLWDSLNSSLENDSASWNDIDLTFASKSSTIVVAIKVINRKVGGEIIPTFSASLGGINITQEESVIGQTNVLAYIEGPQTVASAIDLETPTEAEFKVYLKVLDANRDVKPHDLEISLSLTDSVIVQN